MPKKFVCLLVFFCWTAARGEPQTPKIRFEYSLALDLQCPRNVTPEVLTPAQLQLIPKIGIYQREAQLKLKWFQSQWDSQGSPLLTQAISLLKKSFPFSNLQASLFVCPRIPSMGTPLALNIISYLDSAARDIPELRGKPLPIFFFVSTTFHEVLHKYINFILSRHPSEVLPTLQGSELFKSHLHVFAVQKMVFESLNLQALLSQVEKIESLHGSDYQKAWKSVHGDSALYKKLILEISRP